MKTLFRMFFGAALVVAVAEEVWEVMFPKLVFGAVVALLLWYLWTVVREGGAK